MKPTPTALAANRRVRKFPRTGVRPRTIRMSAFGFLVATLLLAASNPTSASPLAEPPALELLAGEQLIQSLQDPAQRDRAYYELWRRAHRNKDQGFTAFLDTHYDVEVVTCPQEPAEKPIYIVLHGFLPTTHPARETDYAISNPNQLFPPLPGSTDRHPPKPAIDAFTSDGKWIEPFGGDNLLNGTLADINGDGILERIEVASYQVDGAITAQVLEVSTVKLQAQPLLAVLINWGGDEWTHRLGARDDRGFSAIELGPRIGTDMTPKAVFRWDAKARAFVGPKGKRGDHFRRFAPGDVVKQLQAAKASRLKFPKDRDFKAPVAAPSARNQTKPLPPPSDPYERQSLTDLSDADLLRRMGPGRKAQDFERASLIRDHVPPDFWTMDAPRAALALTETNRSEQHRARFQLAVDDREAAHPPKSGSVAVTYVSSRCYNAVDSFYFLRFDPAGSYLAYASLSAGGVVFYNVVHDQPAFDLRLCPLSYVDAHHLAATLWSLDRVRTRGGDQDSWGNFVSSTADGSGTVMLRDGEGTVVCERAGRLWAAELSERWSGDYDHEAFVNFASYLTARTLPERLGKAWTDAAPREQRSTYLQRDQEPRYTEDELQQLARLTTHFLADFSPTQDRVSYAIVAAAAKAAGTLALSEAKPSLEKILAAVPEPKPVRTLDEVRNEMRAIRQTRPNDPEQRVAREQKLNALEAEQDALLRESDSNSPRYLRRVVVSSLRKLAAADNPETLQMWAVAREEDSPWALQRLSRVDTIRYVQALETCMNQLEPRWARQLFEEIVRVDLARATAIAASLPPDKANALTVSAFTVLHQANQLADREQRVTALLAVLQDPKSGWEQRGKAIDLLVPPEEPMRYPQREIDDALLHSLNPDQADAVVNFTQAAACGALALRQRTETFDRMAKLLAKNRDPFLYGRILGATAHLAQVDPGRFNPRLIKIVTPELTATNKQMTEILWAIWSADLRSLGSKLEQLGTSGPDDYEDAKAWSSGGDVTRVAGRFHLARKIADTWNATDPVTQIRLLTALALETAHSLTDEPDPARIFRFKTSLRQSALGLTSPQREQLDAFFQAVIEEPERDDSASAGQRQKIINLVKAIIAPASS